VEPVLLRRRLAGAWPSAREREPCLRLAELAGGLAELSGAALTAVVRLVLEAQQRGEPAAWIVDEEGFFPPDLVDGGIDLDALVIVRVPVTERARAADLLMRSGAFGLVVVELEAAARIRAAYQSRLLALAQKHASAVVFLTDKPPEAPSLGSLVSLRAEITVERRGAGRFACRARAVKDKRRAPGWTDEEVCRGPAGLR